MPQVVKERWTAEDVNTLSAKAATGMGAEQIANLLHRTKGAVYQYAAKYGISLGRNGPASVKAAVARSRAGVADRGARLAAKAKRKAAGPHDVAAFTRAAKAKRPAARRVGR